MRLRLKTVAFIFLALGLGVLTFCFTKIFFESGAVAKFIWNINTFRGMFANLPENLPKEDIIGSYYFMFSDFYSHVPRSVSENSIGYSTFLGSIVSCLFVLYCWPGKIMSRTKNILACTVILCLGLLVRLFLAYHTAGNHDMASWYINKSILDGGGNIYALTDRYNYSPFWFLVESALSKIHQLLPQFPFMFILRAFLSIIDLTIVLFVISITKAFGLSRPKAAALFFLNPISIIITGYHGQFDNIPVFFLLAAVYLCVRFKDGARHLSWLLVTAGTIVKHEILPQVLIFLTHKERSKRKIFILFSCTVILFLATFLPYWKDGSAKIISNVLSYSAISRPYGFIQFGISPIIATSHKYLFIALILCWPFYYKAENLVRSSLIGMLLFLVFASGVSAQQFVLPIALAAIQPSLGFYLFTLTGSLFLFGNIDELKMSFFEYVNWNYVWFSALLWFVIELRRKHTAILVKND